MHAQIMYFDGPRSPELVAAAERAGRERVTPAALADDTLRAAHHATYVLRQPDGGEIVIVVVDDEAALDLAGKVIGSAPLLPGEDPALLPGPDRVVRCSVIHAVEQGVLVLN